MRRQYWLHRNQSEDSIHLEVGHELLLLCEHGLERVELRLQLLDGDLALAHRCRRILQNGLDYGKTRTQRQRRLHCIVHVHTLIFHI